MENVLMLRDRKPGREHLLFCIHVQVMIINGGLLMIKNTWKTK
ncbi:hypothetical protein IOK_20728 [Yersinia enterocolitica subsp. palearctica PhRBD_Ye1]|nr:hypothetical protein IOK_20728 [Yersinia enterocolitica subsp. palearctica PhRBD_Ye1]